MKIKKLFDNHFSNKLDFGRPYIIAEAGVNHECDLGFANKLIESAKRGGADAIKFQLYDANKITCKVSPAYWDTTKEKIVSQHQLFSKYDKFKKKEMEILFNYCRKLDIDFLCTPFDEEAVDDLDEYVDAFKISSSDLTNLPLITKVCKKNKPIILSTGASNYVEIKRTVELINKFRNPLALLHCVLNYPTIDKNLNLLKIRTLYDKFPNCVIGYSDHALPSNDMKVCEIATLLGSMIIEKHFTLDKSLSGNDHYHAMDEHDLKRWKKINKKNHTLLGNSLLKKTANENKARLNARRSIVASKDISKGTYITMSELCFKRPGYGISPFELDKVLGLKVIKDVKEDTLLSWDLFELK